MQHLFTSPPTFSPPPCEHLFVVRQRAERSKKVPVATFTYKKFACGATPSVGHDADRLTMDASLMASSLPARVAARHDAPP
jgi:hypothetical protein